MAKFGKHIVDGSEESDASPNPTSSGAQPSDGGWQVVTTKAATPPTPGTAGSPKSVTAPGTATPPTTSATAATAATQTPAAATAPPPVLPVPSTAATPAATAPTPSTAPTPVSAAPPTGSAAPQTPPAPDPLRLPPVREEDLDWTGFVPLDARQCPVVWVPEDTVCRCKHNKHKWYEVKAGQPTYRPIITRDDESVGDKRKPQKKNRKNPIER